MSLLLSFCLKNSPDIRLPVNGNFPIKFRQNEYTVTLLHRCFCLLVKKLFYVCFQFSLSKSAKCSSASPVAVATFRLSKS